MKRITVLALIIVLAGGAAFAQPRIDVGIDLPIGIGTVLDGTSLELTSTVGNFLATTFLPLPEAGLYYQIDLGGFKIGAGARAVSLILQTIIWPNAFFEIDMDVFVVEAQLGGGAFVLFGRVNDFQTGRVLFPDLSGWFKVGKDQNIRLGGGIAGIFLPGQISAFPIVLYVGGKVVLAAD